MQRLKSLLCLAALLAAALPAAAQEAVPALERRVTLSVENATVPEALQQIVTLKTEHHADEEPAGHDDDERQRARVVDLVDHEPEPHERCRRQAHEEQQESRDRADPLDEIAGREPQLAE